MEVHHQPVFGRVAQHVAIKVHDRLGLVIEEIDLDADDADPLKRRERSAPDPAIAKVLAVQPDPDADAPFARIGDELAKLVLGPPLPEALEEGVLESELAREVDESPLAVECRLASVEESPHRAPRPDPCRAIGKEQRDRVGAPGCARGRRSPGRRDPVR